ncbi:PhaM family polyhydroxyalkanoate granule multifunctional regulatory protein [Paenalcaligenes sp. Me131]|uniref:PhaM family polyhydroxyalkanoate granule multifunctional regulatory protein n=1 Tax=Paenalcaligenes sp. Me131 TaxID=3392636 RepID=UPI003D2726E3
MRNPFDIPGMMGSGMNADSAQNPLFASLDMMRTAWESMGGGAGFGSFADASAAMLSPEELEKRLRDLRAVENWLKLNLSMLEGTIQGLEIQKATLRTVQNFAQQATQMAGERMASGADEGLKQATEQGMQDAGQAVWDLLQKQFNAVASATAASMQSAQSMVDGMTGVVQPVSGDSTMRRAAKPAGTTRPATAKKAAKKAVKKAAKKAVKKATTAPASGSTARKSAPKSSK